MPILILIALNIVFLSSYFRIRKKQKNSKLLTKKNIQRQNVVISLCLIIYIFLNYFIWSIPFIEYDLDMDTFTKVLFYTLILFFSPFFWVSSLYFINKLFLKARINKNMKIDIENDYICYRDNLSSFSPSIVSFILRFSTNLHRDISATILKLKLQGFIAENNGILYVMNKSSTNLLTSEKMILNAIKTKCFDKNKYIELVKNESITLNFVKNYTGNIFKRFFNLFSTLLFPVIIIATMIICVYGVCEVLDEKYPLITHNGICYVQVDKDTYQKFGIPPATGSNSDDALKRIKYRFELLENDVRLNINDKYYIRQEWILPNADFYLSLTLGTSIILGLFTIFFTLQIFFSKIKNFNSNYSRTKLGYELVNKAYGLKNYLTEYSLLKEHSEEQLILWQYYLVYAVALDVNEKIENSVIEKFVKSII